MTTTRLEDTLPELADELRMLLVDQDLYFLAASVADLVLHDRCRCGDHFCATVYTKPKPDGAWGDSLEVIMLNPEAGFMLLDVVDGEIGCIEVLYRDDIRSQVLAAMP